jgi:hypothetical protein
MDLKIGHMVYVEPGRGFATIAHSWDGENLDNIPIFLWNGDGSFQYAKEDDIFQFHEESFCSSVETLTEKLMSYAGNYECPDREESRELVKELDTILRVGFLAQSRGQFHKR